jgi:hypothetical protein
MRKLYYLLLFIFGVFPLMAAYNVIEFSISSKSDTTRIKVVTDNVPIVRDTLLRNPERLVLDFEGGIDQFKAKEFRNLPGGLVMSVRVSQFKPNVARVVLDLAEMPANITTESAADGIAIIFPTPKYPVIENYSSGRKANIPRAPQDKTPQKAEAKPQTQDTSKAATAQKKKKKSLLSRSLRFLMLKSGRSWLTQLRKPTIFEIRLSIQYCRIGTRFWSGHPRQNNSLVKVICQA